MKGRWTAPGIAAVLVALSASALAASPLPPSLIPRAVRLEYIRGLNSERCPDEQDFRDAVGAKVARNLFSPEPPPSGRMVVRLGHRGTGYEGTAELSDATGAVIWTKVYPGPTHPPLSSCESVVDGLALCIAIKVDPVDVPSLAPPVPAPVPEQAPILLSSDSPPTLPLPPPTRSLRLVVGLDGIFTPFLAPSASAGFALWAGIDLLDAPLAFELDLRSTWSLIPARVPLTYQPSFAVRASYLAGIFAGCWRDAVSLCPMLEVGSMSFSEAGAIGKTIGSKILVAAGARVVIARPIGERFVLRGLFEVEGLLKPVFISDYAGNQISTPSPVSLTCGLGFGGAL